MPLVESLRAAASVAISAIRFVNPYQRDRPPPDPGPSCRTRRVLGALGAVAAILIAAVSRREAVEEAASSSWLVVVYCVLVLIAVLLGSQMGRALDERFHYKVILGPFYAVPGSIVVFSLLMTAIDYVRSDDLLGRNLG